MPFRPARILAQPLLLIGLGAGPASAGTMSYVFGPAKGSTDTTVVQPSDRYTANKGYGFEDGKVPVIVPGKGLSAVVSDQAFLFSVRVPEGDYQVDVILGDPKEATETTIRAEQRRLFFELVKVKPGASTGRRLLVDVRTPAIAGGEQISLKPREIGFANWDEKLTLEFDGPHPAVQLIEITPIPHPKTVYLAGDSTVTDQDREPWCSWGQMLPRFLDSTVAVANYAESGETARSFIGEHRWAKVLSVVQKGDYVFLQFGHNDQKDKRPNAGAYTTYTDTLRGMVADVRAHGAIPVLLTSMNRRTFDFDNRVTNSLGDYPDAVRKLAKDEGVALIDLNAMTKTLYEAWGPEIAKKAFVHYLPNSFPGQDKEIKDDTHFCNYGAYELARLVTNGIRTAVPDLMPDLDPGVPKFDPAHPDSVDAFALPHSPGSRAFQVPAQAK